MCTCYLCRWFHATDAILWLLIVLPFFFLQQLFSVSISIVDFFPFFDIFFRWRFGDSNSSCCCFCCHSLAGIAYTQILKYWTVNNMEWNETYIVCLVRFKCDKNALIIFIFLSWLLLLLTHVFFEHSASLYVSNWNSTIVYVLLLQRPNSAQWGILNFSNELLWFLNVNTFRR